MNESDFSALESARKAAELQNLLQKVTQFLVYLEEALTSKNVAVEKAESNVSLDWAPIRHAFEDALMLAVRFVTSEMKKGPDEFLTLSKKLYDAGTPEAVLVALKYCFSSKTEVPEWVRTAYVIAANKLFRGECKTLDEAFGTKRSRGKRGKTHKLSHEDQQRIYERVRAMRNQGIALDDGLFTLVGQEFGIGKTLTKKYYYQCAKTHNRPSCDPVATVLEHVIWATEAMRRLCRAWKAEGSAIP